jgi:hypothetical protein
VSRLPPRLGPSSWATENESQADGRGARARGATVTVNSAATHATHMDTRAIYEVFRV